MFDPFIPVPCHISFWILYHFILSINVSRLKEGGRWCLALPVVGGQAQLHGFQGALGGVQQGLVHGPVVVRLHLDDLTSSSSLIAIQLG